MSPSTCNSGGFQLILFFPTLKRGPLITLLALPPLSQCDVMLEFCVCAARALCLSAGRDPLTSTNYTAKLHMTERPWRTW